MLTALTLSFALGAPVPMGAAPDLPAGPAPRIVVLKPDPEGAVRIPVTRADKAAAGVIVVGIAGNANGGQIVIDGPASSTPVPLTEVKDLKVTTANGKTVDVADAAKRLAKGGVVVVSADGKPVDPQHLKLFRDDVLVLVAPELVPPAPGAIGGNIVIPNLQIQLQPAAPIPVPAPAPPGK
jgi:hypothetical protein